jgi:hypothetical protein
MDRIEHRKFDKLPPPKHEITWQKFFKNSLDKKKK